MHARKSERYWCKGQTESALYSRTAILFGLNTTVIPRTAYFLRITVRDTIGTPFGESMELPNPELDHPLMKTALGRLEPITAPYTDALLESVLAMMARQLPLPHFN